MSKTILQFAFILLPLLNFGTTFITMDTLNVIPFELKEKANGDIDQVLHVDFTGDTKRDYIIQTNVDVEGKFDEIWITSDFKFFNRISKYALEYNFIGFINLDNDPEPEIYSASGYSDGIDYAIYDLNMETGKSELLFYFNPVITDSTRDYWGYPWDTKGFLTQTKNGVTKIFCSVNHEIERDGDITIPNNQKVMPVIFLNGKSTQTEAPVGTVNKRAWLTIEELIKLCITKPKTNTAGQPNAY